MAQSELNTIHPGDLLETLRSTPLLLPFSLNLILDAHSVDEPLEVYPCGRTRPATPCDQLCGPVIREAVNNAVAANRPVTFQCPMGILNFAVPVQNGCHQTSCLIAGGIRDESIRLAPSGEASADVMANEQVLLERIENLPTISREEVERTAGKVQQMLPELLGRNVHALALEKTGRKVQAVTDISREMDRAESAEKLVCQISEALVVLFDIPRVAVLLAENGEPPFLLAGGLGLPSNAAGPDSGLVKELLRQSPQGKTLSPEEASRILPGFSDIETVFVPVTSGDQILGVLLLMEKTLHPRDRLLVELLAGRTATRLTQLQKDAGHQRENAVSRRLIAMISALSLMETREELHHNIVEMAADLLQASSGSLMLLDEGGESLRIESAKGMSLPLARSMRVPLGSGIAGKVARSGFPLLVNDIERDTRVGIPNRPRFRTKSFLSVPIEPKDRLIGVLNLADKENDGIFAEPDLQLLTSFVGHAGIMLERTHVLERAAALEELSVTDPLTGLYNRRFLEKRLEEELSRSSRQNLSFTVMLVDLDNFKIYNDLCGHLAGDYALKRVAAILRHSAREMDVVTRFGGEEFCILLPGTSKKESMFVGERIRRAIEKESFPQESQLPLKRLTASIGLASFSEDSATPASLINAADVALYRAKSEGRNRLVVYDAEMQARHPDRLQRAHESH